MRRPVEQVRVDIERDARSRVPEDPAHLSDVEPQVDDQVAREGVPQVVNPEPRQLLRLSPARSAARPSPRRSTPTTQPVVGSDDQVELLMDRVEASRSLDSDRDVCQDVLTS